MDATSSENTVDITELLREASASLPKGSHLASESFDISSAMMAMELMNPHNDVYMESGRLSASQWIGLIDLSPSNDMLEQIFARTLCLEVSWHQGAVMFESLNACLYTHFGILQHLLAQEEEQGEAFPLSSALLLYATLAQLRSIHNAHVFSQKADYFEDERTQSNEASYIASDQPTDKIVEKLEGLLASASSSLSPFLSTYLHFRLAFLRLTHTLQDSLLKDGFTSLASYVQKVQEQVSVVKEHLSSLQSILETHSLFSGLPQEQEEKKRKEEEEEGSPSSSTTRTSSSRWQTSAQAPRTPSLWQAASCTWTQASGIWFPPTPPRKPWCRCRRWWQTSTSWPVT
jgi:hypothetical protein